MPQVEQNLMVIAKQKLRYHLSFSGMALLIAIGTGCSQLASIRGTVPQDQGAAESVTAETATLPPRRHPPRRRRWNYQSLRKTALMPSRRFS